MQFFRSLIVLFDILTYSINWFVKLLIDYINDIDIQDCEERTPLHYAYSINNREIIKYLIDNGADKMKQ